MLCNKSLPEKPVRAIVMLYFPDIWTIYSAQYGVKFWNKKYNVIKLLIRYYGLVEATSNRILR